MVSYAKKGKVPTWLKYAVGLGGAAVLVRGSQLKTVAEEFTVSVSPVIHSISWTKVIIKANAIFRNPTRFGVSVSHPTVSIFATQQAVTTNSPLQVSQIINKNYRVAGLSEVAFDPITIEINYLSVVGALYRFIRDFFAGKSVSLWHKTICYVDKRLPVNSIGSFTTKRK